MNGRRAIAITLLLLVPGAALAQEENTTVNDSDYDTSVPADDEAYLNESEQETTPEDEPTVSDSDFDTSTPTMDESYLDEALPADDAAASGETAKGTPGFGLLAAVGAVGLAAFALARRR